MSTTTSYPHGYPVPVIIEPTSPHTHTFILLHGRGDSSDDFSRILLRDAYIRTSSGKDTTTKKQDLQSIYPSVKFIFPAAKPRRATALNRTYVNQWFDFMTLQDGPDRETLQTDGVKEGCTYIHFIIKQELKNTGIPPERIVLGGLSQGSATSLFALLTLDEPGLLNVDEESEKQLAGLKIPRLGAFIGMSGRIPFKKRVEANFTDIFGKSPDADGVDISFEGESRDIPKEIQALNSIRDLIYLPPLLPDASPACFKTPAFIGHGDADGTVPISFGEFVRDILGQMTMDVTWKVYPGFGHWYKVPDEIEDIVQFLDQKGVISPHLK
ncbi:alpha/beta-hydrolase [Pluteus cervinus]|uniref:Alpha/beta-hydrolase n=1 Tax=Pluteus cervinus TaxID=181527 RepID=A0ACD3AIA4_9AGAR|nr:alpha/beta-hydrolase [Pluteus cervinus]